MSKKKKAAKEEKKTKKLKDSKSGKNKDKKKKSKKEKKEKKGKKTKDKKLIVEKLLKKEVVTATKKVKTPIKKIVIAKTAAENKTDFSKNHNAKTAIALIRKMTDIAKISSFSKGDERVTVKEVATSKVEFLKKLKN